MLQKSSIWKTAGIFFRNPTKELYLMDISRSINLAHTSVKSNLKALMKENIIKKTIKKQGIRNYPVYKADIYSKEYKKYKIIYNFSSIYESGLVEYLESKLMPKSIVLFGSYQKGEDAEDSDIDLFLECNEEKTELSKFKKNLGRKIQLHFNRNFDSYTKELKNNIVNGIVVMGYLEAYK